MREFQSKMQEQQQASHTSSSSFVKTAPSSAPGAKEDYIDFEEIK